MTEKMKLHLRAGSKPRCGRPGDTTTTDDPKKVDCGMCLDILARVAEADRRKARMARTHSTMS